MTGMPGHRFASHDLLDLGVDAVDADGAEDDGVGTLGDAVVHLAELRIELGVAAGLEQHHIRAVAADLLGNAVVGAEPVGVLQVGEGDADVPGLGDLGRVDGLVHRRLLLLIDDPLDGPSPVLRGQILGGAGLRRGLLREPDGIRATQKGRNAERCRERQAANAYHARPNRHRVPPVCPGRATNSTC